MENLTRNQKLVFDVLTKANGPLSAYSILDRLRGDGMRGPPQVYRALTALLDRRLVHRVETLNAFIACSHAGACEKETFAFVICSRCHQVREIGGGGALRSLAHARGLAGFVITSSCLEFRGICAACADPQTRDAPYAGTH